MRTPTRRAVAEAGAVCFACADGASAVIAVIGAGATLVTIASGRCA